MLRPLLWSLHSMTCSPLRERRVARSPEAQLAAIVSSTALSFGRSTQLRATSSVRSRLAVITGETAPRLGSYARRFHAALEALQAGDPRYLASPMVESYHTLWFELHEELIQLLGRTRAEEAAAGRGA